jgi:hypothetical protein
MKIDVFPGSGRVVGIVALKNYLALPPTGPSNFIAMNMGTAFLRAIKIEVDRRSSRGRDTYRGRLVERKDPLIFWCSHGRSITV